MCYGCECYIGGIVVVDIIWRRLFVSMITGACSLHAVSLCDIVYYVVG